MIWLKSIVRGKKGQGLSPRPLVMCNTIVGSRMKWERNHVQIIMRDEREIVGKKAYRRKETTRKKHNTCACKKEATNACREGRPNDNRVRVFVRFLCK